MHALLREVGIENSKADLLEGYGVHHTTELTDHDLQHLVERLQEMKAEKLTWEGAERKKWRSNLMSLLNKYGVYVTNNDWSAVNHLLLDERVCGKIMYELSTEELMKVCIKLRSMLRKREEIQDIERKLAKLN